MGSKNEAVKKRAVFYIGGYDPKSDAAFFDRVKKEATRYEELVGAKVKAASRQKPHEDITLTQFASNGNHPSGEAWETVTDFHFLTLDDIVLKDFDRPFFTRLSRSFITTWDYLLTGTAFKFLGHAWRFFLYFSYPPMAVVLTVLIAFWLSSYVMGFAYAAAVSWLVFALLVFAAVQLVWKRKFVLHLMDLWSFSRDYLRRRRNDIDAKLDRFAQTTAQAARSGGYDEIIMVGHSTGGALILDVVARAAKIDPAFTTRATNTSILTVGSTALKIGLHPSAGWYRDRLKNLFEDKSINWTEYQSQNDIINFYRTNPAQLMKLGEGIAQRIIIKSVRMKQMVSKTVYARMRKNFFRLHYQFVFGNTKPYHYDFMGICFGPVSLHQRSTTKYVEGPNQ